jgi:peroxiredoxin
MQAKFLFDNCLLSVKNILLFCGLAALFLSTSATAQSPSPALDERKAEEAYEALSERWQAFRDTGGLTIRDGKQWASRFWKMRKTHSRTSAAAQATVKAFEIAVELHELDMMQQMYRAVSYDEDAKARLAKYVPRVIGLTEVGQGQEKKIAEWRRLSRSANPRVQKAALFELAKHWNRFYQYTEARDLLDTLRTKYNVTVDHPRYGERVREMREEHASMSVGKQLPPFSVTTWRGTEVTSADLRGEVTVLYFHAPGCGSCIQTYPKLNALYRQFGNDDFFLLGVSAGYDLLSPEEFSTFLERYDLEWPQVFEDGGRLFERYHDNKMLSTGLLLDRNGRVVHISRSGKPLEATEALQGTTLQEAVATLMQR